MDQDKHRKQVLTALAAAERAVLEDKPRALKAHHEAANDFFSKHTSTTDCCPGYGQPARAYDYYEGVREAICSGCGGYFVVEYKGQPVPYHARKQK
jgi:hypothetical protein